MLLSSSKDCTVYQHMFKDAKRPADEMNPVGFDISVHGDVLSAMSEKISKPSGKCLHEMFIRHIGLYKKERPPVKQNKCWLKPWAFSHLCVQSDC